MKCPLLAIAYSALKDIDYMKEIDCLKKECAWWDRRNHRCVKVSDSYDLSYIRAALEKIADKMPHEGQFRK